MALVSELSTMSFTYKRNRTMFLYGKHASIIINPKQTSVKTLLSEKRTQRLNSNNNSVKGAF